MDSELFNHKLLNVSDMIINELKTNNEKMIELIKKMDNLITLYQE